MGELVPLLTGLLRCRTGVACVLRTKRWRKSCAPFASGSACSSSRKLVGMPGPLFFFRRVKLDDVTRILVVLELDALVSS